ncbi:DNA internalization-related competence protein ComEC/Rec2 [Lachnospiraceae bacterium KK002]
MTNRVVCCLSFSFLMGILFEKYGSLWPAGGLLALLLYTGQAIIRCQEKPWRVILIRSAACMLAFSCGMCHLRTEQSRRDRLEAAAEESGALTVQGEVLRKEEKQEQCLYVLTDTRILADGRVYPGNGILVYSSEHHMQRGDIVKVTGAYDAFQTARNEGNFNEKQYYQSRKTEFRLYAEQETVILRKGGTFVRILEKIRRRLRNTYQQCMSEKNAGLMADMTLGDKSLLEQESKDLYQAAGIGHILAISGLHVSLFGMGLYRLLQKCSCPFFLRILLSAGLVCSFGLLSGMEISTFRAVCMFCLSLSARFLGCSYDSLTSLGVAGALQLWENPFLPDNAGFLFSYGAVLGVTVVAGILRKDRGEEYTEEKSEKSGGGFFRKTGKLLIQHWKDTICMSFCIQLATLPLSLYFYYEISCYSILVNGCVLPFLGILLGLGLLGAVTGSLFPMAGKVILRPAGWLLAGNEKICRSALKLPGAVFLAGKPELILVFVYYGVLAVILYLYRFSNYQSGCHSEHTDNFVSGPVQSPGHRTGKTAAAAGIAAALGMILFLRKGPRFEIDVLDVGQGDGILIQTEEGEHFFLDGGSSDVKQVGTCRILPFLKSRGIGSIRGWIVSHADNDHISGLKELLEEGYGIEYLVLAQGMVRDEASKELLELAEGAGCQVIWVAPGMKFGTEHAEFTVFHPEADGYKTGKEERNDSSLVVSLEYRGFAGLFTGDISAEQEQQLLQRQELNMWMGKTKGKHPDFYKAAHHGSNGSNSLEFLETISPTVTVISCGTGNSYGHPGQEALERIKSVGSQVMCTMDRGQITICPKERGIQVKSFLNLKE